MKAFLDCSFVVLGLVVTCNYFLLVAVFIFILLVVIIKILVTLVDGHVLLEQQNLYKNSVYKYFIIIKLVVFLLSNLLRIRPYYK